MDEYEKVGETPELGPGTKLEVEAHGRTLVLLNVGQIYLALDAHCPNEGTNLARDGRLSGDHLICPNDDWVFDVWTGQRIEPADGPRLRRYAIRVRGNEVLVGPELPPEMRRAG